VFENVRVGDDQRLGEIGEGFRIALSTLDGGRIGIAAQAVGIGRACLEDSLAYAKERQAFGKPIAELQAIQWMLADMATEVDAARLLTWRAATLKDRGEPFSAEAAMAKLFASDVAMKSARNCVQIFGGYGYLKDYPAERHYRDARVNRIFEGTNEINRLLIPGMLARRALKGGLPLIPAAKRLMDEIMSPPSMDAAGDGPLEAERRAVTAMKKVGLMVLGTAMQTYGEKLAEEQEVLIAAADIIIETFASESALLRAAQNGGDLHAAAAKVYINDAAGRIEQSAKTALAAMADGDTLRTLLAALRRLLKVTPINTVVLRRQLADATVERRNYIF
jgi:alkylation response protein AidB-like acyl-CoA dehydrogenase